MLGALEGAWPPKLQTKWQKSHRHRRSSVEDRKTTPHLKADCVKAVKEPLSCRLFRPFPIGMLVGARNKLPVFCLQSEPVFSLSTDAARKVQ